MRSALPTRKRGARRAADFQVMEEPPTVMFDPVGEFKKALDGVVSDEDPEGCVPCPFFVRRRRPRRRYILDKARGEPEFKKEIIGRIMLFRPSRGVLARTKVVVDDACIVVGRLAVRRKEMWKEDEERKAEDARRNAAPKKRQNSEAALQTLRGVLDGLQDVGMAAKECAGLADVDDQVATRCRVLVRASLTARHDQGRKRVIQRRFNVGVLEAILKRKASTL